MKIKSLFIALTGTGLLLFGCAGSPESIDRFGDTLPVLDGTALNTPTSGAESWEEIDSSMFQPTYNRDGSITVLSNRNFQIRIMPMTDSITRGTLNRTTEEFDIMIARYERILHVNQNDYEACIILAGLHIDRSLPGDAEKAVEFSNRALAINQNDLQALYARGIAHSESGNNEQALRDLTAVLRINIQSMKGIYYVMGMIHFKEGNLDKSLQAFEAVKAIDPEFVDIEEVLEELHRLMS